VISLICGNLQGNFAIYRESVGASAPERRTPFEFDFGHDDQPFGGGAPSAEDIMWFLRRR